MLHVLLNLTRSGSALIRVQYLVIRFCLSETHNVYLNRWVVDLASAHARHTISVLLDETYLVMRLKPDCISGLPIRLESNDVFCFRVNRGIVNPILFCLTGNFSTVSYLMGWFWNLIVFPVSRFTWNQMTSLLPSQSGDCESNPVLSYREV